MLLYSYDSATSTPGVFMYSTTTAIKIFAPLPNLSQPFIFIQTENATHGLVLSGNNTSSLFPGATVAVQDTIGVEQAVPEVSPDGTRDSPGLPASAKLGIGFTAVALLIVFGSIYCCWNNKIKKHRKRKAQAGYASTFHHTPEIVPIDPNDPIGGVGMPGAQKMVYTVPEVKGYTEEPEIVQQQPHELGLHPRPKVATTVGEDSARR